jgi:hypothetical protein
MTQLPAIAPLSPQLAQQVSTASVTTPANTGGSASPSESAPSAPGGGGKGVQACMGFWDAQTHMTRGEWHAACSRIENRLTNLKVDSLLLGPARKR